PEPVEAARPAGRFGLRPLPRVERAQRPLVRACGSVIGPGPPGWPTEPLVRRPAVWLARRCDARARGCVWRRAAPCEAPALCGGAQVVLRAAEPCAPDRPDLAQRRPPTCEA